MPAWATGRRNPLPRHGRVGLGTWLYLAPLVVAFAVYAVTPEPLLVGQGRELVGAVEHVTDGDTIQLAGQRIRLTGLDAPEWNQTCATAGAGSWNCGAAATSRLRELVRGRSLTCTSEGHDRYGRLLARCRAGETDIAEAMVTDGLAISTGRYGAAESAARVAKRGLWQGDFVTPAEWRSRDGSSDLQNAGNPSRFERFLAWLASLFAS